MSPRPRTASDEQIIRGTLRVMARTGPSKLTLRAVAREAGITAGAIVQRFGSKRALLLSLAALGPEGNRQLMAGIRASHRSPLAALFSLAACMEQLGRTPDEVSNSLAYFQYELSDPDFYRHTRKTTEIIHQGIRTLVADAIRSGEIVPTDAGRLAHALQAAMNGSLLNWAVYRKGRLRDWIRRDLGTVLRPYRRKR